MCSVRKIHAQTIQHTHMRTDAYKPASKGKLVLRQTASHARVGAKSLDLLLKSKLRLNPQLALKMLTQL